MTQANKIVILEKQARQSILTNLLKEHPFIEDTQFISLNVFLNSFVKDERNADWFKAVSILEKEADRYVTLKEILKFPITADHLLEFITAMADEGWTIDDLPEGNRKDKDLKDVLRRLLPEFDRRRKQWEAVEQLTELSTVSVYDHFYAYPIAQRLLKLQKRGLNLIALPQKEPEIAVFFAKNPRSEAQACVQKIVSDRMPVEDQIIVCLDKQLQNQVEAFLIYYQVPYFRTNESKTNAAFRLVRDLIRLKLEPSLKNLLAFIQNDKLEIKNRLELITYLETFRLDIDRCLDPFTHVQMVLQDPILKDVLRITDYLTLERKAEIGFKPVRAILKRLNQLDKDDFKSFISDLFELYVGLFDEFSDEDAESINKVKSILEEGYPYLCTMDHPYEALLYQLSKLTLATKQSTGVILTDLKHAHIPGKKRIFMLSCTQDFYPQLPTSGGLFDDDYLRSVSPLDQQARYDHHMNNLQKLQKAADEIVYSYPLGSYEGKAKKLPYELEWFFKQKGIGTEPWPLIETDNETAREIRNLDPKLAERIYFENKMLKGSISSFEKYFHCPYQYFLATGLNLKEPPRYGIDNAIMGTLLHLVLENAINAKSTSYAAMLLGHEVEQLRPYFDQLKRLFSDQADELEIMFERTVVMLHLSLEFLAHKEETSPFSTIFVEKEYRAEIDLGCDKKLQLHGFIDRIDIDGSGFMIIDYKSSTKTLSEKFVQRGIQLQLMTYMWIGHEFIGLGTPYGAYYFSLGQTNTSVKALRYKKTEGVIPAKDPLDEWFSGRRLKGWSTQPLQNIDPTEAHLVYKAPYDIKKIENLMRKKYLELIQGLQEGTITKQNSAGSCKYCAYRHFCQFKGEEKKLPAISNKDSILLAKEGE